MDILSMIPTSLYPLVIALWFIGYCIKNTEKIKDCYIPFILMVVSIAACLIMQGVSVDSAILGIIASAISVFGDNLIKQGMKAFNGEQ